LFLSFFGTSLQKPILCHSEAFRELLGSEKRVEGAAIQIPLADQAGIITRQRVEGPFQDCTSAVSNSQLPIAKAFAEKTPSELAAQRS